MKKIRELAIIYTIGSICYSLIEILWRGHTHWTMTITGGICFVGMYLINIGLHEKSIWIKCAACALVVTGMEFFVGCIVNRLLHWQVWDYSNLPFNVLGQICLLFSVLWFFLSIPALFCCERLRRLFYASGTDYQKTAS